MTSHIQRLYAKIQAHRLNNDAFRKGIKSQMCDLKNDLNLVWAAIGLLTVTLFFIAWKI